MDVKPMNDNIDFNQIIDGAVAQLKFLSNSYSKHVREIMELEEENKKLKEQIEALKTKRG